MPHVTTLPEPCKTIHIMGVAGTAMAALAGMLQDAGYTVTGSDKAVYPPMSDYLAGLGIRVMEGFVASNLDHKPDLVVVGNVVRAEYEEAAALLASDLAYCSFPELLGMRFLSQQHSIVVAGTHGKTTTTAIAAWLLEAAGRSPGFLVGGVAKNFDRTARLGAGQAFVIEGDEYDTAFFDKGPKFLHYRAKTAIVTSVEFDHADIYADLDHVKTSFRKLIAGLPSDGLLIARDDDPNVHELSVAAPCEVWTYGPGADWDGRIESVDTDRGTMTFSVTQRGVPFGTFTSSLVGTHNLYNQIAAIAACVRQGLSADELAKGFPTFLGIKRRQEVRGEPGGVTVIDDFAHHPTAVAVTLAALHTRFGDRRIFVAWEPRSATSRRNVFQSAYAEAFDGAYQVYVSRPFDQSRIPVGERFSAEQLVVDLADRGVNAHILEGGQAIAHALAAQAHPGDVLAIFSNGAFDGLHETLLGLLNERFAT